VKDKDFEVQESLGKSGKVLKAHQRSLDRLVVLKLCNPKFFDPEKARSRFIETGRLLGSLAHPNVVQVYGVETPLEGEPFLVLEWVDGASLKAILKREKRLSYARALEYFEGILGALRGIHAEGIVHRNLKPENLLVAEDGRIKLVDFGLALDPEEAAEGAEKMVLGTPSYMSPEQVRGKPLDGRSDLYAAGILFYEMLFGSPPFAGKDARKIMRSHVKELPPLTDEMIAELPPGAVHVLRKSLAKRPEKRYPSAKELLLRVRSLGKEEKLEDRGEARREKLRARREKKKLARRSSQRARWGALGLVLLMVGAAWFWHRAIRRLDNKEAPPVRVEAMARGGEVGFRWESSQPLGTELQYGYTDQVELMEKQAPRVQKHRVELSGLRVGETLYYRVRETETRFGEIHSIHIPSAWQISEPSVQVEATQATVRFTTDIPVRPEVLLRREASIAADDGLQGLGPTSRTAGTGYLVHTGKTTGTEHQILLSNLVSDGSYQGTIRIHPKGESLQWLTFEFHTEEVVSELLFATPGGVAFSGTPRVLSDRILLATVAGQLLVWSSVEKRVLWEVKLETPVRGDLQEDGVQIFGRQGDSSVAAWSLEDGESMWRQDFPAPLVGELAEGGGALVVARKDRHITAMQAETGEKLWDRLVDAEPVGSLGVAVGKQGLEVVCGFADGVVRGYGVGGRKLWSRAFGALLESRPYFYQGGIALIGGGNYQRIRRSRKSTHVTASLGKGAYGVTVSQGTVLVAHRERGIVAMDWGGTERLWDHPLPQGARGLPIVRKGKVYIFSGDGRLYCLRLRDGEVLYSAQLGSEPVSSPVCTRDGCFVATYGGHLLRFQ
jgi:outer membrane protein assembly factor BamB/tRNA A-37 threonylcarbamoyl transferase component Bud32